MSELLRTLGYLLVLAQPAEFAYRETDTIPGATMEERLRHVSKRDLLDSTKADEWRCGPAAILDAYLMLGGDWKAAARRLKVGEEFTFENVHRAQEALYDRANTDGKPGIEMGYLLDWDDNDGKLRGWDLKAGDEAHVVFEQLGLEFFPLYGPFKEKLALKRANVEEALSAKAATVLIVGRVEDRYVLVFRREGEYYALDPGAKAGPEALRKLSEAEMAAMVFETSNAVIAVRLKP